MKTTSIYGVQALLGVVTLAAGAATLAGADMMVHQFEVIGLGQTVRVVAGTLQLIAGLGLLVPRTAVLGAAVLATVMVGMTGATIGRVAAHRVGPAGLPQPAAVQTHQAVLSTERRAVAPVVDTSSTRGWNI